MGNKSINSPKPKSKIGGYNAVKFAGKRKNAAESAGEVAFSSEWSRSRGWVSDFRIQLSFCSQDVTLPDYNH